MANMEGKTVLITGANQGIGKAAAIALGGMGAKLVLICRSEEKARAAIADIEAASKPGTPKVELIVADLASQAEVRRAAAEVLAKHDRLDVLMNNAGVIVPSRRETVDGIEETFAINHLAPFLLTNLLLGLLAKSGPARVINVSSTAHYRGKMKWDDLQHKSGYSAMAVYAQSKLCNILFTRELARRLPEMGAPQVTTNTLHPGVIASGFGSTYGGVLSVLVKIARPFFANTEDGAKTQVWLASSPEVANVTGKYFDKCAEKTPSREARDEAAPRRLWEISEAMTGLRAVASTAA